MSIYNETINELKDKKEISELYRFQGNNSRHSIDIKNDKPLSYNSDKYIYFSNSLDHHKYFMIKRIKQLINEILKNEPYNLNRMSLNHYKYYNNIKKLVLYSDKIKDLYSIKLICQSDFYKLIKDNYFYPSNKNEKMVIERVDRKVYGGGYGITNEWQELLNYMTLFISYQKIDRNMLLNLLINMRTQGTNRINNIDFITNKPENYSIKINSSLTNNFTKYDIINCLESIMEKGLYNHNSELGNNPTKTIKKIASNYEHDKDKVLTLLMRNSQNYEK